MAIYPYAVKCNGEYYESGEDVPEVEDMAEEKNTLPFSDDDITFETKDKQYTKTDINKMNKAELQELARNTGVEGVNDMTGGELKEYLLSLFGL